MSIREGKHVVKRTQTESPVVLYGCRGRVDQFRGVPAELESRGLATHYERLWGDEIAFGGHAHPCAIRLAGAVVCADLTHNGHVRIVRMARHYETPSVLLVDGVVEWSNVMLNRWLGFRHLRPAPEDIVLCSGTIHAEILAKMGNTVVTTGLPRLDGFAETVARIRKQQECTAHKCVLVATANFPAVQETARARILMCLETLRDALLKMNIGVMWRLTGGLCKTLGVERDTRPLVESLARTDALLTTASTVAVEGMLANVPTCVVHPHPWPLWVPGAWVWSPTVMYIANDEQQGEVQRRLAESEAVCQVAADGIARRCKDIDPATITTCKPLRQQATEVVEALLSPDESRLAAQQRLLDGMHTQDSAARVAEALEQVVSRKPGVFDDAKERAALEPIGPTLIRSADRSEVKTVVSLVVSRDRPVSAIASWSRCMGKTFASTPTLGYQFHTLHVTTNPIQYVESSPAFDSDDPQQHVLTLEPTEGTAARLRRIVDALAALKADVVIPNEGDLAFAACAHLRNSGARTVVVAHHDASSLRQELAQYTGLDAIVHAGPEYASIPDWLSDVLPGGPDARIAYGVPVHDGQCPRHAAPLKIVSIGTVMHDQMRVFDLIPLLAHLQRNRVAFHFHLIGDGPDLDAWIKRAAAEGLGEDVVTVHGQLAPWEVELLLKHADFSVLATEMEGAGMAMPEAMGIGVVPCVTDASVGASQLIRDGVEGVVVPVGAMRVMAERIAKLSHHPDALTAMSCAARSRITSEGLDANQMAMRYAVIFDEVIQDRLPKVPNDDAVRLQPAKIIRHSDDAPACDQWLRESLAASGYISIADGTPKAGCDAVLVRACDRRPTLEDVRTWRAAGLGVAISPNLSLDESELRAERALFDLCDRGFRRVALCTAPGHTQRIARLIEHGPPIVGFIDELALQGDTHMGLPVVAPEDAVRVLAPDAVLLIGSNSEPALLKTCAPLHESGVPLECVDIAPVDRFL